MVEWLTTKEVMERLKISVSTLHRIRRKGLLPVYRVLGSVRYKSTDVEDAVKKVC